MGYFPRSIRTVSMTSGTSVGVARAVGEKYAVRLIAIDDRCRRVPRHCGYTAAAREQRTHDILFHPAVHGDDVERCFRGLLRADFAAAHSGDGVMRDGRILQNPEGAFAVGVDASVSSALRVP